MQGGLNIPYGQSRDFLKLDLWKDKAIHINVVHVCLRLTLLFIDTFKLLIIYVYTMLANSVLKLKLITLALPLWSKCVF